MKFWRVFLYLCHCCRDRVEELESELVNTQRSAGLPVRLPSRILLSPPELLKKQPVGREKLLVYLRVVWNRVILYGSASDF